MLIAYLHVLYNHYITIVGIQRKINISNDRFFFLVNKSSVSRRKASGNIRCKIKSLIGSFKRLSDLFYLIDLFDRPKQHLFILLNLIALSDI